MIFFLMKNRLNMKTNEGTLGNTNFKGKMEEKAVKNTAKRSEK